MKKITVKEAIAEIIKSEGVEYVFGYTGGHILQLWEAVNNAGLKCILNKQEGNAVYMADGYIRTSGKMAVVLGTVGPGAANMATGLANAFLDSIPLVAICGQVATSAFGRNPLQDGSGRGHSIDQRGLFKSICKMSATAPSPEAVPELIRDAFRTALSGPRPGPVFVEIPDDFWDTVINYEMIDPASYKHPQSSLCSPLNIPHFAELFYQSKKPLVIVGEGSADDHLQETLLRFIEKTGVPVALSPIAKNYFDNSHPWLLGVMRRVGNKPLYEYLKDSDLVLLLGDRLQEWEMDWYNRSLVAKAKLLQVDPDPNEIGRVYPVAASTVGNIPSFLEGFPLKKHPQSEEIGREINLLRNRSPRPAIYPEGRDGLHPGNINNVVEELAAPAAVIVTDTGNAKLLSISQFRLKKGQKFIVADKFGPMGYGLPAALGAALATGQEVICFIGDGGFQMSCNELGTALNYGLKVIYIIENNSGCASVANYQTSIYGHYCACDFQNPDFVQLAKSYGFSGYGARTADEFRNAFRLAQSTKGTVIIDAVCDRKLNIS